MDQERRVDDEVEVLPLWLLRARHRPYGARMLKQPKLDLRKVESWERGGPWKDANEKSAYPGNRGVTSFPIAQARTDEGNIPNHEYQFWAGQRMPTSLQARCHVCGFSAWNAGDRKSHLQLVTEKELIPCSIKLTCIMKAAQKLGKCIICGDRVWMESKWRWGFPMCSIRCENLWKFDIMGTIGDDTIFHDLYKECAAKGWLKE